MSFEKKWNYEEDGLPAFDNLENLFEKRSEMQVERERRGLPSDGTTGVYAYELKQMLEQVPDTARIGLRWGENGREVCFELDAQFTFEKNIVFEPRSDSDTSDYVVDIREEEYDD